MISCVVCVCVQVWGMLVWCMLMGVDISACLEATGRAVGPPHPSLPYSSGASSLIESGARVPLSPPSTESSRSTRGRGQLVLWTLGPELRIWHVRSQRFYPLSHLHSLYSPCFLTQTQNRILSGLQSITVPALLVALESGVG